MINVKCAKFSKAVIAKGRLLVLVFQGVNGTTRALYILEYQYHAGVHYLRDCVRTVMGFDVYTKKQSPAEKCSVSGHVIFTVNVAYGAWAI